MIFYTRKIRYIAALVFVTALLFLYVNIYYIFPSFSGLIVQSTEKEAVLTMKMLSSMLISEEGDFKLIPADIEKAIIKHKGDFGFEKIKAFTADGEIIYSTDPKEIGGVNENIYFKEHVAKGEIYTKEVKKDSRTLEGRKIKVDVLETYVPVMHGDRFIGAFEIYYDITSRNTAINSIAIRYAVLSLLLILVFMALSILILVKEETPESYFELSVLSKIYASPIYILLIMMVSLFIVEVIVMRIIHLLPEVSPSFRVILDAMFLVMLAAPVLYLFLLRPLLKYIKERNIAEAGLKDAHDILETKVKERTIQLSDTVLKLEEQMVALKKTEEGLFESEERLRSILDTANDAIVSIDKRGRIIFFNPAMETLFGYTPEELAGKPITIIVPASYHDAHTKGLEQVVETGETNIIGKTLELYGLKKDGREFPIELSISMWKMDKEPFFTGIIKDITERKNSEETINRQLNRLNALHTIDMAITSSYDLHATLVVLLNQIVFQLGVDAATVLLMDQKSNTLKSASSLGFRTSALKNERIKLGESIAERAVIERKTLNIPDLRKIPEKFIRSELFIAEDFVSYFAVPLITKGKVNGILEVFYRSLFEPEEGWLDFLQAIALQAAIAIDDAKLFEDLNRSNIELSIAYESTLEGWSNALEIRDKETYGHSRRVTQMTLRIARKFGINDDDLGHIKWGALLHDIGKMGTPDSILNKPGKLNEEEWEIMKKHPSIAYDLLYRIEYLRPALNIPYCHHEKWDGTGYPRGLKGDEIPLAARIFAVVDVWDALSSDRPYRNAWPQKKVIEHIRAESGKHFDPAVVEVFLKVL